MCGEHIALVRLLRVHPVLKSTVTLAAFVGLCAFQSLASLILTNGLGKYLFVMARSLHPLMRVLRLSDMKTAVMDKLLFYVRQTSEFLPRYLAEAEAVGLTFLTAELRTVMTSTDDIVGDHGRTRAVPVCEEDEEQEEEEESEEEDESEDECEEESEEEDDEEAVGASEWRGDSLTHRVMRTWTRRRGALVHEYSLVGHLCSPNPVIMADAAKAMSIGAAEYDWAVESLIRKLLLDPSLVGLERGRRMSFLLEKFWQEYNYFQSRTGPYSRDHI